MTTSRIFTKEWTKLFKFGKNVSANNMFPGNFYQIVVYQYADPKETKTLSGLETAFIFLIGKFRQSINGKSQVYMPAIKLKNVNPRNFFESLKLALDNIDEELIDSSEEFRFLLRKFPLDGKPLFSLIKKKKLVYDGNYREYKLDSIQSVKILELDKEYIKVKLLPEYSSSERKIEEEKKLREPKESPNELNKEKTINKVQKNEEINLKDISDKMEISLEIIKSPSTANK